MKKLLAIDGNSILNRAYYGIRSLSTSDGRPTNAVYGMINIVYKHICDISPDYLAVAYDVHVPTFRHKYYADYKAGRHATPDDLLAQMEPSKKLLESFGAHILEKAGYEADDILGTLGRMSENEGIEAYIVTGDRDSLQLISDSTCVLLATTGESKHYGKAEFSAEYGVDSGDFVDVKALMGDSSDNIPGVPGIGKKTALDLVAAHGGLDRIYASISSPDIKESVRKKLTDGKDSAYMSKYLATIDREVPLGITLEDISFNGINAKSAVPELENLEFHALASKVALLSADEPVLKEKKKITAVEASAEKAFENGDFFGVYIDKESKRIYVCSGENVFYTEDVEQYLCALSGGKRYAVYDAKDFLHAVSIYGIKLEIPDDIMLMSYLSSKETGESTLAKMIYRSYGTDEPKSAEMAYYIKELYGKLKTELENTEQYKLYSDIELPLAGVLSDMETRGFHVDVPALESFSEKLGKTGEELAERIYLQTGCSFNINSPKQLGEVLFEKLGLPCEKKTKSGYSTSADVLEKLGKYSEIVSDILDYRQVMKLKSTYADGLAKASDENGRVHTCFKQALTATGRLSSTEPNLQNIPIKTELGREFRKYFVAPEGRVLIDADYSQIELRLLAAISGDESMANAFINGADIHTSTAMKIFGVGADEVTIEMRKRAKAINFGIVYGMGDFSLASDLHISRKTAAEYIENYLSTYPKVEQYLKNIVIKAKQDTYVTTLFGRRRYIPELASRKKQEIAFGERVAMNSPIQGSAADIIKLAMVNTYNKLKEMNLDAHLILQVHDELIIESAEDCADKVEKLLKEEMEHAVSLSVPLNVEIGIGKSWYSAKK